KQKGTLDTPLIHARIHESSNSIQLLIYMKDREHIFYDVLTILSNSEVDIVNAQVINASDGFALQTFRLTPVNIHNSEMELVAEQIVNRLHDKLSKKTETAQSSLSSSLKHKYFSSPTVINFDNSDDNSTTLLSIETINRVGVLENIAKAFVDCDVKILNARIATVGEKALDYFTISSADDKSLSDQQQNNLKQQLKESL
ncbi:MAG: hypothetical protein KAJ32_03360, partial [Gammaproteobacteria bacterium]|nr:hypothetical protein [Gammaproteobacteria bacterium]